MLALQELTFYYKLTHNGLPDYFQNWQIVTNSELHRHNTRRKHDIHIVGFIHTFAKRCTVVPVMNGHPRDQAKVSVRYRWPLVTGTDGQAGDAKYNTPCNTT